MKTWADTHPKAKLMARKRSEILAAAHQAFLRDGYAGASMEGIAGEAGVSIMTLYRHAKRKDDLFEAVIAAACAHSDTDIAAWEASMQLVSLHDFLGTFGIRFQERLFQRDTLALLQSVMNEATRFPQLAETAYQALIADWGENLQAMLSRRPECSECSPHHIRAMTAGLLDDLIGIDVFRALLGLQAPTLTERQVRADSAAARLLEKVGI